MLMCYWWAVYGVSSLRLHLEVSEPFVEPEGVCVWLLGCAVLHSNGNGEGMCTLPGAAVIYCGNLSCGLKYCPSPEPPRPNRKRSDNYEFVLSTRAGLPM